MSTPASLVSTSTRSRDTNPDVILPREWTTPRILRAIQIALAVWSVILFVLAEATLDRARHATRTIWKDTAPSILVALEIQTLLADLDADAANVFLDPDRGDATLQSFENERVLTSRRLVEAAQNITYGDEEKVPIMAISEHLGRYFELIGKALLLHELGERTNKIEAYRAATDLMHDKLLPAARMLDKANADVMTGVYLDQSLTTRDREALTILAGVAMLMGLMAAQVFLAVRTRRIFNLPLLGATLGTIALCVYLGTLFASSSKQLKIAREDAFQSIQHLSTIRAIAHDANGDESRYLLDRARAAASERAFADKVYVLTTSPATVTFPPARTGAKTLPGFSGLFANVAENVTFAGEREAVIAMLVKFEKYWRIDATIRSREASATTADHASAVRMCLGESNTAFVEFEQALARVIKLNDDEFQRELASADRSLRRAEIVDPFLSGLVALLAFAGIRQRAREYD